MAHEHAQYATQPVNFNDSQDDFFRPTSQSPPHTTGAFTANDEGRKTYNDRSSVLTGWTSGITVPYSVPLNEEGQTHAQAVINEYNSSRGSRVEPPLPPVPSHLRARSADKEGGDRKSVGPVSVFILFI